MSPESQIAIIIPVGPKEEAWRSLLPQLDFVPPECIYLVGIKPLETGLPQGVRWIVSPQGRAQQLNSGVQAARENFLWFLHADSQLTPSCVSELRKAVQSNSDAIYYFNLGFHESSQLMKITSLGVWIRSHFFQLPFGDQGFLLSRRTFEKLGGFDETALYGEDHLLVWKAHQSGIPVLPLSGTLLTSSRKYRDNGWIKTTSRHLFLTVKQAWPQLTQSLSSKKAKP